MRTFWDRLAHLVYHVVGPDRADREMALLSPTTRLVDDLHFGELDRMELLIAAEREFEVDLDTEVAAGWETLADVRASIEESLA